MADIFVVDDEPMIHVLYQKIFSRRGCNIIGEAFNGSEAIVKIKELHQEPDIVIMDHRMPIKDGLETTSCLLKLFPSLKVIFVSADSSIKIQAKIIGAKLFIEKPFDFEFLVESIVELINT